MNIIREEISRALHSDVPNLTGKMLYIMGGVILHNFFKKV